MEQIVHNQNLAGIFTKIDSFFSFISKNICLEKLLQVCTVWYKIASNVCTVLEMEKELNNLFVYALETLKVFLYDGNE